jgi:hypothetical protein
VFPYTWAQRRGRSTDCESLLTALSDRLRTAGFTGLLTGQGRQSAGAVARARRFRQLVGRFPNLEDMGVVDLGGEAQTWIEAQVRPREVVLLNIPWMARSQQERLDEQGLGWIRAVGGDACDPPAELTEQRCDLVFSNSVIEHVGGHQRRAAFADAVHRLAPHHWVQTPNRYFPIEPHWLFPGFQFLPARGRAEVQRRWPVGHFAALRGKQDDRDRMRDVLEVELVSKSELRWYFPDSEILAERVGPMTKSWIVVR